MPNVVRERRERQYADGACNQLMNGDKRKREFYIDTPLGKLRVYAKHVTDCAEDYPGVFVDLVAEGENIMLARVEYDSGDKNLLTTAYDRNVDEPVIAHHHDICKEDEND